jgi:L,D-transpeptidase catalytic domain
MPTPVSYGVLRLYHQAFGGQTLMRLATGVLAGTALLICHSAFAATWNTTSNEPAVIFDWQPENRWHPEPALGNQPAHPLNTSFGIAPLWDGDLALSPTEQRVALIAWHNGDRDYLMVDKSRGKIILFASGRPIFSRSALTGESMADRIPADAWSTPWSQQSGVKFKVTPAGRFTITRNHDLALGELFDINELQGRDWTIAIHRVWLGKVSERRDARLRSDIDQDKHITNGCIDVDPSTMAQLSRVLPSRGMPLYILPNDENLIGYVFRAGVKRNGPRR